MTVKITNYLFIIFGFVVIGPSFAQTNNEVWVQHIGTPQYFAVDVKDVGISANWYKKTFGLTELEGSGSEATDGRWQIMNLHNDHLFVELIRDNRAEEVERAKGFAKVGFQVRDVSIIADRVFKETGEMPFVANWEKFNMSILQLEDPDGNIIQLTSKILP